MLRVAVQESGQARTNRSGEHLEMSLGAGSPLSFFAASHGGPWELTPEG